MHTTHKLLRCFRIVVLLILTFLLLLQDHQYETVSGFVCENFGYIPTIGECIVVVLEKKNEDNDAPNTDHQDQKETFKLEVINLLLSGIHHLRQSL